MRLGRWLSSAGSLAATVAGVTVGIALALSAPTARAERFLFERVSILSWRGQDDSTPPGVETSGWSAPMFYSTPEEGGSLAGRLPTGQWAPGDAVQRTLVVRNVDPVYMVSLEAIQIRLRGEMGLAPWFRVAVLDEAARILYEGSLSDFASEPRPLLNPLLLRRNGQERLQFRVTLDRETDQRYQGASIMADFIIVARGYAHPIRIDVHPGSWPNPISPLAQGNTPVAVNGGSDLDVTQLDWSTARFGPNGIPPVRPAALEDWNNDGHLDMILHFETKLSGITCGMTSVTLTIASFAGEVYEGSDAILTPPC